MQIAFWVDDVGIGKNNSRECLWATACSWESTAYYLHSWFEGESKATSCEVSGLWFVFFILYLFNAKCYIGWCCLYSLFFFFFGSLQILWESYLQRHEELLPKHLLRLSYSWALYFPVWFYVIPLDLQICHMIHYLFFLSVTLDLMIML